MGRFHVIPVMARIARMKNPTPLLFAIESRVPKPVCVEPTEEIEEGLAVLLLQVLEAETEQEVNDDEE